MGKTIKKLPLALTLEEFVKLMKNAKKIEYRTAFLLGFGSGLRVSEVVNLIRNDVDLNEKAIKIRQGKGSKDRIVPLPKGFKQIHYNSLPLGIGARALQKAFKLSCQKAGLLKSKPELHFHSLRHGFGSRLANQGVPIHHIRTLMGHSNISTTNVYLELNPKEALAKYQEVF